MKKAEKCFKEFGVTGAVTFPVVLKSVLGDGTPEVAVIYRNRAEYYRLVHRVNNSYLKKNDDVYDPYKELEMVLGNGGTIIRGGDY